MLVDAPGLLLSLMVLPAGIQDRDGGVLLLADLRGRFPFPRKLFADGGTQGPVFAEGAGKAMKELEVEIVKRSDAAKGFEVTRCAGSSSARSDGTTDAAAWRRTSRTGPRTPSPSSS